VDIVPNGGVWNLIRVKKALIKKKKTGIPPASNWAVMHPI
jgi:hypothetical protein